METPHKIWTPLCLVGICLVSFSAGPFVSTAFASESMPKGRQVLPASKFVGRAAIGYKAAGEAPDLMAKLFCYCGCDVIDKHHSLLDCYVTDHSADCQICQDEAIMAVHMRKEGKSVAQIQRAIDNSFSGQYPWSKPTEQLLEYQKTLTPTNQVKALDNTKTESKKENIKNPAADILKPGAKMPNCCGGH
jgi:Protein of unknown function with PCYCGC motif